MEIQIPHQFKPRDYQLPFLKAMDRGILRAILCWNRRCLIEGTPIAMADGSFKPIEEIKQGDSVLSYDGELKSKKVINVFRNGKQKTYNFNGLYATVNHEVLSKNKWTEIGKASSLTNAGELKFGKLHNPELAEFLGLMISDGSITWNQTPKFTNIDNDILDRFRYLVKKLFPEVVLKEYKKGKGFDLVCTLKKRTGRGKHIFRKYFTDSNLMPEIIWKMDKDSILAFLGGVISGDGSIYYKQNKTPRGLKAVTGQMVIEAGISNALAEQYRLILLKFGIRAKIKHDKRGRNARVFIYSLSSLHNLKGIKIVHKKKQQKYNFVLDNTKKHRGNFWQEKKYILGEQIGETFDLNIEDNHNYIANGYIVHNSGKDKVCFNYTVKKAFEKIGTYFYFLPTYSQAKKVIWDNIDNDGFRMLDHIPKELVKNTNATELKIELVNGSIIQLIGADEFKKSGVGTNPVGVVFSEYSLTDPEAWRYVSPILAANDGWAVFNFTPRGQNHAWQLLQQAKDNPNWFIEILTINETKVLTEEALDEERRMNPQDIIEQEYFCKFIEGAGAFFKRIHDNVYNADDKEIQGHTYQIGLDLAKTMDYTVITPFDLTTFKVLKQERFNQIDYNLQKAKIEASYLRFFKPMINMDSTGVGEPIYDDLWQKGIRVNPYKFTEQSRRDLLVNLQLLLEQGKIKIPNDETLISELQSFRYTVNEKGRTRIEVPEGLHDDMVFSLALAVWQIPQNPTGIKTPLSNLLNRNIEDNIKITSYE